MPISLERYVSATSGVIGADAVGQRELVGLRFTSDPRLPIGTTLAVDKLGASDYFGAGSVEAVFAANYFSYVSPAPVSTPSKLRFAPWAPSAREPRVFGGAAVYLASDFAAITDGALGLTLGEFSAVLTGLNFASVLTLADVASVIQTAIRAQLDGGAQWAGAAVSYDSTARAFLLVGGAAGEAAVVLSAPSTGTDVAPLLGWSSAGTILSPGCAAQTPLQAFQAVNAQTDNFGSFSFESLTSAQANAVAVFNASLNVKYMFFVSVSLSNYAEFSTALEGIRSCGLVLNGTAGQYKEAIPQGYQAAINYDGRNAAANPMFRQVSGMVADVNDDTLANILDPLRINYYGATAEAGQKIAFFQRGFLQGSTSDPLDIGVHSNEQWLKSRLLARMLSLLLSLGQIPPNEDGRGYVRSIIVDTARAAKDNGVFQIARTLTTEQKIAIAQASGDPEAWREVQTAGFWCDVRMVAITGPSGVTEYEAQYTLIYAKADSVRKVDGSHNLV